MFLIDSLIIGGLSFVLDKIALAANQEDESLETVQQQLLEAQLQLEEGAITDEAFAEIESALLARLRELKQTSPGGVADAKSFDGIEIAVDE